MIVAEVKKKEKKKRFPCLESNLGPSRYEAGKYPIPPFRHGRSGLEKSDDIQRIRHEKTSRSTIVVVRRRGARFFPVLLFLFLRDKEGLQTTVGTSFTYNLRTGSQKSLIKNLLTRSQWKILKGFFFLCVWQATDAHKLFDKFGYTFFEHHHHHPSSLFH